MNNQGLGLDMKFCNVTGGTGIDRSSVTTGGYLSK